MLRKAQITAHDMKNVMANENVLNFLMLFKNL